MAKDVYIGAATALVGLLTVFLLVPFGVELSEVDSSTLMLIRPDFWPLVIGWLMVIGGIIFTVIAWKQRYVIQVEGEPKKEISLAAQTDSRKLAACAGVVVVFLLTGEWSGLVLPAIALFLISAFAFRGGKMWMKLAGSILMPILLVLFFERVANIPIPLGILEQLI